MGNPSQNPRIDTTATLIGRDHAVGVLRAEIARAADSHGGLVLVTGEAGIGKTTLIADAAEQARRRGAVVLSGSCWDSDSAPGFWPWVQVLRGLKRRTSEEWAAAGANLLALLGEPGDQGDGFEVYDAVTTALVSASQQRPIVVILEDLHWADTASLRLLEFVAQHTWFERLLLLGSYRDVEVEATDHPLQSLMTPLVAKATTVTLTGMNQSEVATLIARTAGLEPEPDQVSEVHRHTGGNPFFVEQTVRLWSSGGSVTAIAPGVRNAVQRRLSLLPPAVSRLLAAAAVLGREFHGEVLSAMADVPVDRLLDQAVAARLVVASGDDTFGFAHDLVRETLYQDLDEGATRSWHAAVVRALDRTPTLAGRIFPADVARHAYLAGDQLELSGRRKLLLAAARDATGRMAWEEAIGHHRRALELSADAHERATVGLELGGGLHHTGEKAEAWRHFADAAAAAREAGDPELLARVAITLHRHGDPGESVELRESLVREAHRVLIGPAEQPDGLEQLMRELIEQTSIVARRGGDDETLAFSLSAHHDSIWGPGTAREREALTAEMEAVARRTGDRDLEQWAASLRWVALFEQGDPRFLDQFHAFVAMAERFDTPRMRMGAVIDRSIIMMVSGRFEEAERLIDRVAGNAEPGHPTFTSMIIQLRWGLWLRQGRFDELEPLLAGLNAADHPHRDLLLGITAAEKGDHERARRYLLEMSSRQESLPRWITSLWLRFQAQTAAATGDAELCERARAELEPHAGEWAVSWFGCDIGGPIDHWLAMLDTAQQRWADAVVRFTAAHESADQLGARTWSLDARAGLANALFARGLAGDADTAARLLDRVEAEAAEIGMSHVVGRVRRTRNARSTVPPPTNVFRADGPVWNLVFEGYTAHMPDAKGLRDLHLLLGQPDSDVPAVTLLSSDGGEVAVAARMGGDAVLDAVAKARYKKHLSLLDDQIDLAAERGDAGRVASLDQERQALLDELRAAAGLAGRDRRLGDAAERARKTVTARIRDTLRKLDVRHPALAAHLRASVTTGATCRYQPDHHIAWRL